MTKELLERLTELDNRITDYLSCGGLFNPELANHDAVRDLIMDCRTEIKAALSQPAEGMVPEAEMERIARNWANRIDQIARQKHSYRDYELEIRYAIKEALKFAAPQDEKA